MCGTVVLCRNVVDRKQVKARAANTFVPKLNMSLARKTAAFRDPEERKSLIAFSKFVMGFPLLLVIVNLYLQPVWHFRYQRY